MSRLAAVHVNPDAFLPMKRNHIERKRARSIRHIGYSVICDTRQPSANSADYGHGLISEWSGDSDTFGACLCIAGLMTLIAVVLL